MFRIAKAQGCRFYLGSDAHHPASFEKVKSIVAAQLRLEPESIADDASLIEDLGADSLDLVDIVMAFESEFDTTVSEEEFSELRTIKDLADYISARI